MISNANIILSANIILYANIKYNIMNNTFLSSVSKKVKICVECKKEFLGVVVKNFIKGKEFQEFRFIYTKLDDYPLQCGRCIECAKTCYKKAYETLEAPCINKEDIPDIDDNTVFVTDFVECAPYFDTEWYIYYYEHPDENVPATGILIDLFEFFNHNKKFSNEDQMKKVEDLQKSDNSESN